MSQSKLNQLQKAIIELVPEIRELKFGCNVYASVETLNGSEKFFGKILYFDFDLSEFGKSEDYCEVFFPVIGESEDTTRTYFGDKITEIEIIGRDIILADVLLALKKKGRTEIIIDFLTKWDLTEPLHLQDEETINFLHDVICQHQIT